MQDYETEEQQIEAIKGWWKENGTSLIIGISIGLMSIGGWKYYVKSEQTHRVEASDLYISVMKQVEANNVDSANMENADKLVAEYTDTPYASLSSLSLANYEFSKGNTDKAISHLQWVKTHSIEDEIKHIAVLRLARILISQKKYDEASAELLNDHPAAFIAGYEELKGDLYVAKGYIEMARVAYDKAIEQSSSSTRLLILKRQDIGSSELKKSAMEQPPT